MITRCPPALSICLHALRAGSALSAAWAWSAAAAEPKDVRPNVLFIAVDDLRPQLGCYGVSWMKTPNIDRLAASGVRFDRHYVQMAVCIPSRVALLTSLRSERTHQIYGPMRWQNVSGAVGLGSYFGAHGYATVSLGKIWHAEGGPSGDTFDTVWKAKSVRYADPVNISLDEASKANPKSRVKKGGKRQNEPDFKMPPITECADVPDNTYEDGKIADQAIEQLGGLKGSGKPFLLAVGFLKPHIPFVAPKKYWDLYREADLPLAPQPDFPKNMPRIAYSGNPNFYNYDYGVFARLGYDLPMPDDSARHVIHGYCAAASFADAQVGRVLAELKRLGLERNTIVVLWGDHGFHLGDLRMWGKQTNFERATHSPLIIRAPGMASAATCSAFAETVDIFPTLVDLAGLPPLPVSDGSSLVTWLKEPSAKGKPAIYHMFDRPPVQGSKAPTIGYAVRTADVRYVEWHSGWGLDQPLVAREFYRYSVDHPDEEINLADDPAFASAVAEHAKLLRENPACRPLGIPRR